MFISEEKTKCKTICIQPIRIKLKTNKRIMEQSSGNNHLGVNITTYGNHYQGTATQIKKATKAGALKYKWNNKSM